MSDSELRYQGQVILPNGGEVDVWFVHENDRLRLGSDEGDLGSWSVSECRFERIGSSMYDFTVEGEDLRFRPEDPVAFDALIEIVEGSISSKPEEASSAISPGSSFFGTAPESSEPEIPGPVGEDIWGPLSVAPTPSKFETPEVPQTPSGDELQGGKWVDAVAGYVERLSYETPEISSVGDAASAPIPPEYRESVFQKPSEGESVESEETETTPKFGQRRSLRRQVSAPASTQSDEGGLDLAGLSRSLRPGGDSDDPVPPEKLAQALDELVDRSPRDENAALSVPESISVTKRLRETTKVASDFPEHLKKIVMVLGLIFLGTGLVIGGWTAWSAWSSSRQSAPDETTTTTAPEATTTVTSEVTTTVTTEAPTTVPTTVAPLTVFEKPAEDFVRAWNEIAIPQVPKLEIPTLFPPGAFDMELTNYVTISGAVKADATLGPMTLAIDPTGPKEEDDIGIASIGLLMRVSDPNLTGSQRTTLLSRMGFDVDYPDLDGLDGTTNANGIRYHIWYDEEATRLMFNIQPE